MKIYIYIFFLVIATISCCQKPECERLTPDDLEWIPFMFQDKTLTFINIDDTTDKLLYTVNIYPPQQYELDFDYWDQCDDICGEAIYIEYEPGPANYKIYFSIYRAYNQLGLNTSGSGGIAGSNFDEIGFNAGIFYKTYSTHYHTYNDVYKYPRNKDTIWYAKNYGIIKMYDDYLVKNIELKN